MTTSAGATLLDWLLDSDPAIRWQVLRDLADAPSEVVATERARVAADGWSARLLQLQAPDGLWSGMAFSQDRTDTFHVLELLRRLGLEPESEQARLAVGRVRQHVTWGDGAWWNPPWADSGFFEGEVEPCIAVTDFLGGGAPAALPDVGGTVGGASSTLEAQAQDAVSKLQDFFGSPAALPDVGGTVGGTTSTLQAQAQEAVSKLQDFFGNAPAVPDVGGTVGGATSTMEAQAQQAVSTLQDFFRSPANLPDVGGSITGATSAIQGQAEGAGASLEGFLDGSGAGGASADDR